MKKILFSILFFIAPTAIAEEAMKDSDMYEMMFGIPGGDPTFANIISANIPGYIRPFLTYSLVLAAASLSVVALFVFLFGGMDTSNQKKLLGKQVDVEKIALRMGVASFLLVPVSGGMTIGGLLILLSSGFVSKGLDALNAEAQSAVIGDAISDVKSIPPAINRKEWGQLLRSLICLEHSYKDGNLPSSIRPEPVNNFNFPSELTRSNGSVLYLAGVNIPGSTKEWIWGANIDRNACGGFVAETKTPDPDRVNSSSGPMGQLLNIVSAGARGITQGVGYSIFLHTRANFLPDGGDTLRKLAWAIVHNKLTDDEDDPLSEKIMASRQMFDRTFIDVNKRIKQVHQQQVSQIIPAVEAAVSDLSDEMAEDGWMMAWANAFKLTNVASIIEPLSATRTRIYVRDVSFFDENTTAIIGELETIARSAEGADMAQSAVLSSYPTINANSGDDGSYDSDGKIKLTSSRYCEDALSNYTCFGRTTMEQLMYLSQELKYSTETHPLVTLNSIGSAISSDAFNNLLSGGLLVSLARSVAYGLQSIPGPWTQVPGRVMEDKINDGYGIYVIIQKAKYFLFKSIQMLPSALITLAGIIVNVDWVVTLFLMLFAVHLYAIFNALPRGNGITSDYAQRGIPAFLGAIFMPFYNLTFLYVALLVMRFAFPFLGASFMIFLGFIFSYTDAGWIDSLLYTALFAIAVLMVMKLCIHIMTNGPDRILKLLGVHEALTSGFTPGEAESRTSEHIRLAGEGAQKAGAPLNVVHKDNEPVGKMPANNPPPGRHPPPTSPENQPPPGGGDSEPVPVDTREKPEDEMKPYSETGEINGDLAKPRNVTTEQSPSGVKIVDGVAHVSSDEKPQGSSASSRVKGGFSRIVAATKVGFGVESYEKAFFGGGKPKEPPPVNQPMDFNREESDPSAPETNKDDGSKDSRQKRSEIDEIKSSYDKTDKNGEAGD